VNCYEFMIQPRKGALKNFLIKTALLIANYSLPVVTVVVYLEKGKYKTFPDEFEHRFLGFRNRFILDKILLWKYRDKIESGELLELAPLLPLFYQKPELHVLEKEHELILKVPDFQQRSDLIALAMMVAFRKYETKFVQEFFKKEYQMLKESTFVKEWIHEGWEKGIKEGVKEGKKEGLEEGIEYGKLALLLHLVKTKFKTINSKIESQLKKLKDKQIDELSAQLFKMGDIEELNAWLRNNKSNNQK